MVILFNSIMFLILLIPSDNDSEMNLDSEGLVTREFLRMMYLGGNIPSTAVAFYILNIRYSTTVVFHLIFSVTAYVLSD